MNKSVFAAAVQRLATEFLNPLVGDRPGGGLLVDVVTPLAFVWLVINVEPILETETSDVPGNGDLSVVGILDVIGATDIESVERISTSMADRRDRLEWDGTSIVWSWLISVLEGELLKVFKEMVSIVVEFDTTADFKLILVKWKWCGEYDIGGLFGLSIIFVCESQTLADDVIVGRSSVVENSVLPTEATERKPIVLFDSWEKMFCVITLKLPIMSEFVSVDNEEGIKEPDWEVNGVLIIVPVEITDEEFPESNKANKTNRVVQAFSKVEKRERKCLL